MAEETLQRDGVSLSARDPEGLCATTDKAARTLGAPCVICLLYTSRPFTFCASAISMSHPMSSRLSWTKRAPFIDSIAALTGPPRAATSLAR